MGACESGDGESSSILGYFLSDNPIHLSVFSWRALRCVQFQWLLIGDIWILQALAEFWRCDVPLAGFTVAGHSTPRHTTPTEKLTYSLERQTQFLKEFLRKSFKILKDQSFEGNSITGWFCRQTNYVCSLDELRTGIFVSCELSSIHYTELNRIIWSRNLPIKKSLLLFSL